MDAKALFAVPDVSQARRVLCVQPHYDDNDIGAGGTIARLHAEGAEIYYLTATNDLVGVTDPELSDEEATARLRAEQAEAGASIGVSAHYWLGLPDAGPYDYYTLRQGILQHIRMLRPDLVLTPDPWLPYESHSDHRQVGLAAAECLSLYNMLRLPTDPEVDANYEPYRMLGVGFYFTHRPNTIIDITEYRQAKYRAMAAYRTQISPESLPYLEGVLDLKQKEYGAEKGYAYAEAFKVLGPGQLHCNVDADR